MPWLLLALWLHVRASDLLERGQRLAAESRLAVCGQALGQGVAVCE